MGKAFDTLRKLDLRINSKNVLFFDMDDTLVNTNFANYLSYKKAIQQIMQSDIDMSYNHNTRFNREILKKVIPDLTKTEYERIVQLKNELYIEYLPKTKLNDSVVNILVTYSKINKTVLVTNCQEDRAFATLKHHGITDKFDHIFYKQVNDENKINKYEIALLNLKISPVIVLVFENEKPEIDAAISAGIPVQNILTF
jgi:beta-phosphoglucomutase